MRAADRATDTAMNAIAGGDGFGSRRGLERQKRVFAHQIAENIEIDDRSGMVAVMNFETLQRPARAEAAVDQHCTDAVDIHRSFVHRERIETYRQRFRETGRTSLVRVHTVKLIQARQN